MTFTYESCHNNDLKLLRCCIQMKINEKLTAWYGFVDLRGNVLQQWIADPEDPSHLRGADDGIIRLTAEQKKEITKILVQQYAAISR